MIKGIKEYHIRRMTWCRYIPILDKDPEYAAKFLTRRDLVSSYKLLKEVFEEIRNNKKYHEILYDTVMDSKNNFYWFSKFFETMEEILKVSEDKKYNIPFNKAPFNLGVAPNVVQPYFYSCVRKEHKVSVKYYRTNVKNQDPINNYRIRYIVEDYEMNDFQDDEYPGWYVLKNTTIYEQYNEKTNTRVRIDFRDGQFFYFIAGASDNWEMIPDVPIEMNHVISALLFRHLDN